MSLTDQAELRDMNAGPAVRKYNPRFHGDLPTCYRRTGHCSNTDACADCILYQTTMEVREEKNAYRE